MNLKSYGNLPNSAQEVPGGGLIILTQLDQFQCKEGPEE